MVLSTIKESEAPEVARSLLARTSEEAPQPSSRVIMEMITTIIVYKFEQFSRREVEEMLGITLKHTKVYQEITEEGCEEATVKLIIRLLTKRFGTISGELSSVIADLPLPILEDLSEALLDFTSLADLQTWLATVKG
jgi:predicted transposase YdaD